MCSPLCSKAYDDQPADIWPAYREALATIGTAVRVERPDQTVEGHAVDVERDGRLVVIDACAITHRIDTGDVIHLRSASSPTDGVLSGDGAFDVPFAP